MKIVAFSDLHGQQNRKLTEWFDNNPADLLIFAGDLQANNYDYGEGFIDWIHKLPYKYKVLLVGNHDGNYLRTQYHAAVLRDIIFLNNHTAVIDGIAIFGSPYTVKYGNWWFMLEDNELEKIWKTIPNDIDILVTHGPPFGILDCTREGITAGSKTLLKRVNELKNLKYHIFGHIHEAYGIKTVNNKTFINTSLLNERYSLVNNPVIIEYELDSTETDYNVGE